MDVRTREELWRPGTHVGRERRSSVSLSSATTTNGGQRGPAGPGHMGGNLFDESGGGRDDGGRRRPWFADYEDID